jgi:hypothetical protein
VIGIDRLIRRGVLIGGLLLVGITIMACSEGGDSSLSVVQTPEGIVGSFAGRVDGTNVLVGLVVGEADRETLAYVSDGKSVATWFEGHAEVDAVELTSYGAQFTARLSTAAATGTVTLADGRVLQFTASPTSGEAGLYRGTRTAGGLEYIGGWIVLPDGEQRGTVVAGGATYPPGHFDPANPIVELPFGTMEVPQVTPSSLRSLLEPDT